MRDRPNERNRDAEGNFSAGDTPRKRQICVSLSEPFISALDAFGNENGTGRGGSIETLLRERLGVSHALPKLPPAVKEKVQIQLIEKSNPLYLQYKDSHYIENRGTVGQQIAYLIIYDGKEVGIIGGSSSVFKNRFRDEFFELSDIKEAKTVQLNSIINNYVFKLDYGAPNLASIVLSMWRKQITVDWEKVYGVKVAGFETFVVEERLWDGRKRDGVCYRSDNWELLGITLGNEGTNVRGRKVENKTLEARKLVYGRKVKGVPLCEEYNSSWNDKERQKEIKKIRAQMIPDKVEQLIRLHQNQS